ncbi:hypothetical protein BGZ99_001895, partial [Dissophora globulifera]
MSILKLACTASDSNSVWGLTIGANYTTANMIDYYGEISYYAIVKSNANPTQNTADLTWSLVSVFNVPIAEVFMFGVKDEVSYFVYHCAVNSNGAFTFFYTSSVNGGSLHPEGYRYDPAASLNSSSYNQKPDFGPGAWFGLTIDPTFVWPVYIYNPTLFYASGDAGSTPSLVFAYSESSESTNISFASLNENTKTLSFVGSWVSLSSSYIKSLVYANNQLFVYSTSSSGSFLSAYPLAAATAVAPVPRIFNMSATNSCYTGNYFYSGVVSDAFYLICASSSSQPTNLYTLANININGSSISPGRILADSLIQMTNWNFIIGSDGMGTAAIAFMIGSNHTYILSMSGSSVGVISGPSDITIPETLAGTHSLMFSSPVSTVGLILGILGGAVFIIGIAFYIYRKKNSDLKRGTYSTTVKKHQAMPSATTGVYTQGYNQTEVVSMPGAATQYIIRPADVPATTTPTATFTGAGNADAGHSSQQPYAFQQPVPQDHIPGQQLQLTSHPRPNFVTTVGGDGADNLTQLSEVRTSDDTSSPYN